jgi:hypothetical protein
MRIGFTGQACPEPVEAACPEPDEGSCAAATPAPLVSATALESAMMQCVIVMAASPDRVYYFIDSREWGHR